MAGSVFAGERRIDKPGREACSRDAAAQRCAARVLPFVSRGGLKLQCRPRSLPLDVRKAGWRSTSVRRPAASPTACCSGAQAEGLRGRRMRLWAAPREASLRSPGHLAASGSTLASSRPSHRARSRSTVLVADVSFISLRLVLPSAVKRLLAPGRPGWPPSSSPSSKRGRGEVGRGGGGARSWRRGRGPSRALRSTFVRDELHLSVRGTIDSPIAGPTGNVEALLVADKRVDPALEADGESYWRAEA